MPINKWMSKKTIFKKQKHITKKYFKDFPSLRKSKKSKYGLLSDSNSLTENNCH